MVIVTVGKNDSNWDKFVFENCGGNEIGFVCRVDDEAFSGSCVPN